jgi:hypothetical protein
VTDRTGYIGNTFGPNGFCCLASYDSVRGVIAWDGKAGKQLWRYKLIDLVLSKAEGLLHLDEHLNALLMSNPAHE